MNQDSRTIDPSSLTTKELHGHLLACVAPRPIALASTVDKDGNVNLSPFSFFNVFSANPPILIFSPARRGKDNTTKHSYDNVKEVGEVVINIVNHAMAQKMYLTSLEYGKGVNEFEKSGLTPIASEKITPPRVLECPVSFECTVDKVVELGSEGGAGNLVICRVELIHIKDEYIGANGLPDTTKLDLIARMGADWYCRASGDALFKVSDLYEVKGIGLEMLSQSIRNSNILTETEMAKLAEIGNIPSHDEVVNAKEKMEVRELFLEFETQRDMIKDALHRMGKKLIHDGKTYEALTVLMIVDII